MQSKNAKIPCDDRRMDYRDLVAWQKSMDLAERIHIATAKFPKEERYGLISQIRRASVSRHRISLKVAPQQRRRVREISTNRDGLIGRIGNASRVGSAPYLSGKQQATALRSQPMKSGDF
jgi:hypothetical protein